jgi:hypothetical protein
MAVHWGMPMRKFIAAATLALAALAPAPVAASRYLFVWAMETRDPSTAMPPPSTMGRDFLAVFDARRGAHFGKLIAMLPVGSGARMAHHTNYEMPKDGLLFASDYMTAKGYVLDVRDPARPKLTASFADAGPYTYPHSFARLPNGDTLATYQFKGTPDGAAGALVELDRAGRVVRASDAADVATDPYIRPYSALALPGIDRVVTTSAPMMATDKSTHVVQLWRLSDLKLLKTIPLERPPHFADAVAKSASEARLLEDGKTALVVTAGCGLYRIADLASPNPEVRFVHDFGFRSCGVPTVVGRYWIQTSTSGRQLISLDVRDPAHPKEVSRLVLGDDAFPHWVAREPDGNRIVITGFGSLATHALFARLNPRTGALTLEPEQIDFNRSWPDHWSGPAMPHAAIFGD